MKLNAKRFNVNDHIFFYVFDSMTDMNIVTMRPQSYLESPMFAGTIFSRQDIRKLYPKTDRNTTAFDKDNYYTRWAGQNFSSEMLKPFYEGKFDPLCEEEQALLDEFKDEKEGFYFIAGYKRAKDIVSTLRHEIAHALFFLDKEYREKSLEYVRASDTTAINKVMEDVSGYHENVWEDEIHAYAIDRSYRPDSSDVKKAIVNSVPMELHEKMLPLFEEHAKKNNVRFFTYEELVS